MSNINEGKPNCISSLDWEKTPENVRILLSEVDSQEQFKQNFPKELQDRVAVITTLVMDTGLLASWVFLQWLLGNFVVEKLVLTSIDKWTLVVFQIIFAFSTSTAIGAYTWKDISLIILRAQDEVENERKLLKEKSKEDQLKKILENRGS
jgi:hypothetical protein